MMGMNYIASGRVTSPTQHIDVPLPAGYAAYEFIIDNTACGGANANGGWFLALSYNNGANWIGDNVHSDTYIATYNSFYCTLQGGSPQAYPGSYKDFMIDPQWGNGPNVAVLVSTRYLIYPGSPAPGDSLNVIIDSWGNTTAPSAPTTGLNSIFYINAVNVLNPKATIPPVYGSVNMARIMSFPNTTIAAADGYPLTQGSWLLQGLVLPGLELPSS